MDSSIKGLTSSTPTRPISIPKSSSTGDIDENDLNQDQIDFKLPTPRKSSSKRFMSPTISAANKSTVTRKKILGERNETSTLTDTTHLPKTSSFDSKTSAMRTSYSKTSMVRTSYSSASEVDDDDDDRTSFVSDSLNMKPYDPVTNYLSPRPKFLRYKQNRRQKKILDKENEFGKGNQSMPDNDDVHRSFSAEESSEDVRSSVVSASLDGSVKEDDVKVDKIEGDVDEEDIRDGNYEFGDKESVMSDLQQAVKEEESAADDHSSSASSPLECLVKEEAEKIENIEIDRDIEEEEEIEEFQEERGWSLRVVLKFFFVFGAVLASTLYISSMNSPTFVPTLESIEDGYYGVSNVTFETANSNIIESGSKPSDITREMQLVEVNQRNIDDEGVDKEECVEVDERGFVESTDETGEVTEVKINSSEDAHDYELKRKLEVVDEFQKSDTQEDDVVSEHEIENNGEGCDQMEDIETAEKTESFQDSHVPQVSELAENDNEIKPEGKTTTEGPVKEVAENEMERADDATINTETDSTEGFIFKQRETDSIAKPVIGISILVAILASLGGVYFSRKKKSSAEISPPIVKAEEISPVVESVANPPSSLIGSKEEAHIEYHQEISAPSVALLGELVLGEENSSLKSFGVMKSKALETEESNVSVSQEKSSRSQVKTQAELSQQDFSTADSPSYGSFLTSEKKIVKKEEATPVRRSSRLRNRSSVLSP